MAPKSESCTQNVRIRWFAGIARFTKSLLTTKVGDGTRTRDLPDHKRFRHENLDLTWDWPDWKEPRQTPSVSGFSYSTEAKWEQPAFPRFPIHSPADVREVYAPTDEMNACPECGATVVRLPKDTWKCSNCGLVF